MHYLDVACNAPGASHLAAAGYRPALARLKELGAPAVWLHGSGRQWADPRRPWVVQEKDDFAASLAAAGVRVEQRHYFQAATAPAGGEAGGAGEAEVAGDGDADGLKEHFGVLDRFDPGDS